MFCPNCGKKYKVGERYCTYCGNSLETQTANNINKPNNDASIITGIFACLFFTTPIISIPLAVITIVLSGKYKKENQTKSAGTVLGVISIILSILTIIAIILFLKFVANNFVEIIDDFQLNDIIEQYKEHNYQEPFNIIGHTCKANDNSMLYLNNDNTYMWYLNDNQHEDNYYQGRYNSYNGQEAIEYISTYLKEYGITEEEQENLFEEGTKKLRNYYLIVLTCEKTKVDGKEQSEEIKTAYYYGFYSQIEKQLDLTDIRTKKKITFTLIDKLNNIDI